LTGRLTLAAAAFAIAIGFYSLGARLGDSTNRQDAAGPATHERVRAALDEPDAIARTALLTNALTDLREDELAEVVVAYEERLKLVPPSRSAIELLGEAWASIDPEGAIDRIDGWPEAPRRIGLSSVTRAWAGQAPMAAFTWADSLLLEDREAAIDAVFGGWAETDDNEIWGVLSRLIPGFDRESATNVVMKTVVQNHGFDELFERIDMIESDFAPGSPRDFKLSALRTAVGLCAYHDPHKALAHARRYAGGPYDNGLLRRVAIYWAVNDGPGAMQALLELPSEPQRDKALRDGYMKWVRSHGKAALGWMPAEAAIDERYAPLIDLYTMALAQSRATNPVDPIRQALVWVDRIPDSRRQRDASVLIGGLWLRHEPDAAEAWIEARGIGKDVEAALKLWRRREGRRPGRELQDAQTAKPDRPVAE